MIDVRSYAKVPGTLTQPSINPYLQESTTGSLHHCTIPPFSLIENKPNFSLVENPFSYVLFLMCLVVDCSEKLVKSGYLGVIICNWWRKVGKIGIFANQNVYYTRNPYEHPE